MKKAWERIKQYVRSREFDKKGMREDLRKLGTGFIITGMVGFLVNNDHISAGVGFLIAVLGLIAWVVGLTR